MKNDFPETLMEAVRYFSDPDIALKFMVQIRWPDGVYCPRCDSCEWSFISTRRVWKCKSCKKQFTVKLGTVMEDSPIGLDKWLCAMWMICGCKNGVSSYEIHRALGITQKSAWFLLHRIRAAMQNGSFQKQLRGHVEVDETYIGGKARNMHRSVLAKRVEQFATPHTGRNQNIGKVAVMGVLERRGEVRTMIIPDTKRHSLDRNIKQHVAQGSQVYTDKLRSYNHLSNDYIHAVIDHAEKYVDGQIHTNLRRYLENGEEPLFDLVFKRGDRKGPITVGVRHFADQSSCTCKICDAHKYKPTTGALPPIPIA